MFQFLLFVGSIIAFIIGGLIVLIGIGAITGVAGGLIVMGAGAVIAFIGIWSVINYFLPSPGDFPAKTPTITLVKNNNGKWVKA